MDFIYSKEPIESAAQALSRTLREHLSRGERVLWLLSGGSSLSIAVKTAELIKGVNTANLSITLTDERYGPVGHKNENWQQLLDAGFNVEGATMLRPLTGESRSHTRKAFGDWIQEHIKSADYRIGIFGIGADGHTAGIKPGSPAILARTAAADFSGEDFERITITFPAIRQCDEAIVQLSGNDKKPIVESLLSADLPLAVMPAQILKAIPKVTIFSNIAISTAERGE